MKFTSAALLAIAGFAVADSTQTAKDISDQAKKIQSAIEGLDSAVKAYTGGEISKISSASNTVGEATKTAQGALGPAAPLTLTDALGIQNIFTALQTTIETTMTDLVAIKSKVVAANQGCEVQKQLDAQQSNSNALAKLITSKVPVDVKAVAESLAGNVGESIVKAKTAYADACTGGGSVPGPAGGAHGAGSDHGTMSPAAGASGAPKGSKTSVSTTSTAPKPAVYTGAASSLNVPVLGALAMGAAAAFAL
jgi:hypothetical protein